MANLETSLVSTPSCSRNISVTTETAPGSNLKLWFKVLGVAFLISVLAHGAKAGPTTSYLKPTNAAKTSVTEKRGQEGLPMTFECRAEPGQDPNDRLSWTGLPNLKYSHQKPFDIADGDDVFPDYAHQYGISTPYPGQYDLILLKAANENHGMHFKCSHDGKVIKEYVLHITGMNNTTVKKYLSENGSDGHVTSTAKNMTNVPTSEIGTKHLPLHIILPAVLILILLTIAIVTVACIIRQRKCCRNARVEENK